MLGVNLNCILDNDEFDPAACIIRLVTYERDGAIEGLLENLEISRQRGYADDDGEDRIESR